ncbi:hypothetical protein PENSPDRAFT_749719 [Peniophora sp. CONT]|nr:hypothetical protein PENSPDRAFT_749719 [Peniophora sp. CONT]
MSSAVAAPPPAPVTSGGKPNLTTMPRPASSSDQFTEIWTQAWRKFEEQTRSDKPRSELAKKLHIQLKNCHNIDTIVNILCQRIDEADSAQADGPKWTTLRTRCLRPAVQVILAFNDALAEVAAFFDHVVPGGKAIFVAFGVLLEASQRCNDAYTALFEIFENLKLSMESLRVRTDASCMGPASKGVAVLVLVHLLDMLTLAIKLLPPMPWSGWFGVKSIIINYWRGLLKNNEMTNAIHRLQELTHLETRAIVAETQVSTTAILEHTNEISQLLTGLLKSPRDDAANIVNIIKSAIDGVLDKIDRIDGADLLAQGGDSCLPDTRLDVLDKLRSWSRDSTAPPIYWLNGMAGTGKSTIARSFGHYLYGESRLGGSFFCSRGDDATLKNAQFILPTLSRALAAEDPEYRSALVRVLGGRGVELRPVVWPLKDQVDKLLQKPFEDIVAARRDAKGKRTLLLPRQLVLVIDALDETTGKIIEDLLKALVAALEKIKLPIKIFLTSRPEEHIRSQLGKLSDESILRLHDIEREVVEKDIRRYVVHRFNTIVESFRDLTLPLNWPKSRDVERVVQLAGHLFIHAFTTTKYISDGNPVERLKDVVGHAAAPSANPLDDLDRVYIFILESIHGNYKEKRLTWRILAAIFTVQHPLNVSTLADLLDVTVFDIQLSLRQLHAVIHVPTSIDRGTVSTFHASFGDFIMDPRRAPSGMWINPQLGHFDLAIRCAEIMGLQEIHFSTQCLRLYEHSSRTEVATSPPHVRYACVNWPHHMVHGNEIDDLRLNLEEFFIVKFTSWGETGEVQDIDVAIKDYRSTLGSAVSGSPTYTSDLGHSLMIRFERTGKIEESNLAMDALRRALQMMPQDHSSASHILSNFGLASMLRFTRLAESEDIHQAISAHARAIELTPEGHPHQVTRMGNLGRSHLLRYKHIGGIKDLEQSIVMHSRALSLAPEDHPDLSVYLSNLGSSLIFEYRRTSQIEDSNTALEVLEHAISLVLPHNHPAAPTVLENIGDLLLARYERIGILEELYKAIAAHRRACELTPDDHAEKPLRLNSIGDSLLARFEHIGELESLEQAISAHRRAYELTPEGHPDQPWRMRSLGNSLGARFKRVGELDDLESAIFAHRRAYELTPEGHPDRPLQLSNMGNSLLARYRRGGDAGDLESAISAHRRASDLTPDDHPSLSFCYDGLSQSLQCRFELHGDLEDLFAAISLLHRAIVLTPDSHPDQSLWLRHLGSAQELLFKHSQIPADFNAAIDSYEAATMKPLALPSNRLKSAISCVHMLSTYPAFTSTGPSVLSMLARTISILPDIMYPRYDIKQRHSEFKKVEEFITSAVAMAIHVGALRQAITWIESGKAVLASIWLPGLSLRAPPEELKYSHPKLAESLHNIQTRLQSLTSNGSNDLPGISAGTAMDYRCELIMQRDKILKEIQGCPGFGNFPHLYDFEKLLSSPEFLSEPVVLFNLHSSRCDALILRAGGDITLAPLLDLSIERAVSLEKIWTRHLMNERVRGTVAPGRLVRSPVNAGSQLLDQMWHWIVLPVLQALGFASLVNNAHLPRITWCPTGPLAQLPLHSAGVFGVPSGPRAFNLVVSSYIPSLSTLRRCGDSVAVHRTAPTALVITQPETPGRGPIPGVRVESRLLSEVLSGARITAKILDHKHATVESVRGALSKHSWIHLACHGEQNPEDMTQSAFMLYDGPLTLSNLLTVTTDDAELAFLSACQTTGIYNSEKMPNECANLAAGMLAVGFKGVVATMWSIQDQDAPIVVEAYYKKLLELRSSVAIGKGETGAAYALHEAVKVLREKVGEQNFMRWIPFVHFGV